MLAFGLLAILFIVNWFVWTSIIFAGMPHTLRVSVFSVGEGRAILVQSPTGERVLIDAGPSRTILRALSQKLGPFNKTLSLMIQTTSYPSELGGMESVLNRYSVRAFMAPDVVNSTLSARMLARAEGALPHLVHIIARKGMRINIGGGAVIEVLSAPKVGASSSSVHNKNDAMVLRIVYGKTAFLLPGDISASAQSSLVSSVPAEALAGDVLLVGHYGAPNSVSANLLRAVHPDVAVISVGRNLYGYPSSETIRQLRDMGARVLSTRANGAVTFSSDGARVHTSFEHVSGK